MERTQAVGRINNEIKTAQADPIDNGSFQVYLRRLFILVVIQIGEYLLRPKRLCSPHARDDFLCQRATFSDKAEGSLDPFGHQDCHHSASDDDAWQDGGKRKS